MVKATQAIQLANSSLKHSVDQLCRLQPGTQTLVVSLISRLAKAEGVSISKGHKLPIENLEPWITKLKAERKAERTIRLYGYLARRFLKQLPEPTRADIREYLAMRIEETSSSSAETERKALASLFFFLYEEGLWHENPLDRVRHIIIKI